jgi:hypothetical protein
MKRFGLIAIAMLCVSTIATGQDGTAPPTLPQIKSADGKVLQRAQPVQCVNNAGNEVACGGGSGGGGGTADAATATNQQAIISELNGTGAAATQTQGSSANAAVPTGNPNLIAGFDGTNVRTIATDTTGKLSITAAVTGTVTAANTTGNVASGATDSGNPLKIGGVASTGLPTAVTAGQRVNAWFTTNGAQVVSDADGGPVTVTPLAAVGTLFTTQTTGYAGVSFITTAGWSGSTIAFEGSNDSTTGTDGLWAPIAAQIVASSSPTTQTQSPSTSFFIPAYATWIRARVSAFSTGTVGGTARLRSYAPLTQTAVISNIKAIAYTEVSNVALAASTSTTRTSRDVGASTGSTLNYAHFSCFANPTVASTGAQLVMLGSNDNTNFTTVLSIAAASALPVSLEARLFFRYNACRFDNGTVAQTNLYVSSQIGE